MIKRILAVASLLLSGAVAGVFYWGPAVVENRMNPVTSAANTWPVSDKARDLHGRLMIADLHSDALLWDRDLLQFGTTGHSDIPRLAQGNVALQVFSTVTKSPRGQSYSHNSSDAPDNITALIIGQLRPFKSWFSLSERALDQAQRLQAMADQAPQQLQLIRTQQDLAGLLARRARGDRVLGAILATEGAHPLEGDLGNLARLDEAGFRIIGLTHFFDNELGGSLHGSQGPDAGLSDFGRDVIAQMHQRGLIVDVAHGSPQLVRDVLALPDVTPILSHTGIHSQCQTPRNLPDDLLQAIALKGGIVGIGYWSDVNCGGQPNDIAASIIAAIELLGEDHVALGSDFDGAVGVPFDAAHLAILTQALLGNGLAEPQIAKVMGGNMIEFLARHLPR